MRLPRIDRHVSWQGEVSTQVHVYEQRLRIASFEVDTTTSDNFRAMVRDLMQTPLSKLQTYGDT